MSIALNDPDTNKNLVRFYEREIGVEKGYISGNTQRLADFVADVNEELDTFLHIATRADGTWQVDDSNYTTDDGDLPIIYTDLVANQSDYSFLTDEFGNVILDLLRVYILSNGQYIPLEYVDRTNNDNRGLYSEDGNTGTPRVYDKSGNTITLDPIPVANVTEGLKVEINREAYYFSVSDTTKKPGVPGVLHKVFYIGPAYKYARQNNLANLSRLERDYFSLVGSPEDPEDFGQIGQYLASRNEDGHQRLTVNKHSNK